MTSEDLLKKIRACGGILLSGKESEDNKNIIKKAYGEDPSGIIMEGSFQIEYECVSDIQFKKSGKNCEIEIYCLSVHRYHKGKVVSKNLCGYLLYDL